MLKEIVLVLVGVVIGIALLLVIMIPILEDKNEKIRHYEVIDNLRKLREVKYDDYIRNVSIRD